MNEWSGCIHGNSRLTFPPAHAHENHNGVYSTSPPINFSSENNFPASCLASCAYLFSFIATKLSSPQSKNDEKKKWINNENTQQYNRIHLHHLFIYNISTVALAFIVTHTRNNKYNGIKVYYIFAWLYGFLLYLFFLFYISSFYTLLVLAGIMVVSRQMGST